MQHKMAVIIKDMNGLLRELGFDKFFNVDLKDNIYYIETKLEYDYQLFVIGRFTEAENFFRLRSDITQYAQSLKKGR